MYIVSVGQYRCVNVCQGVFSTQSNIYSENHKKRFIVEVLLGSKYASGISLTVENVVKVNFKNLLLIFLFLELIENM